MSQKLKNLKEKLRRAIREELVEYDNLNTQSEEEQDELEEASMTGNLDGGEGPPKTPYAFQSKKKRAQDKKKEDEISTNSTGFTKVNEGRFYAFYNNKKYKIDGKDAYDAKLQAIKKLKVPKSKVGVLAIKSAKAYNNQQFRFESINEALNTKGVREFRGELPLLIKYVKNLNTLIKKREAGKATRQNDASISSLTYILQGRFSKLANMLKNKNLNEGRYHTWRNDESLTPKQKIGRSIREVRDSLNGLSKTIDMSVKLKNELKVNSSDYWKTTHKALGKISERLVKLANKVGKLQ